MARRLPSLPQLIIATGICAGSLLQSQLQVNEECVACAHACLERSPSGGDTEGTAQDGGKQGQAGQEEASLPQTAVRSFSITQGMSVAVAGRRPPAGSGFQGAGALVPRVVGHGEESKDTEPGTTYPPVPSVHFYVPSLDFSPEDSIYSTRMPRSIQNLVPDPPSQPTPPKLFPARLTALLPAGDSSRNPPVVPVTHHPALSLAPHFYPSENSISFTFNRY